MERAHLTYAHLMTAPTYRKCFPPSPVAVAISHDSFPSRVFAAESQQRADLPVAGVLSSRLRRRTAAGEQTPCRRAVNFNRDGRDAPVARATALHASEARHLVVLASRGRALHQTLRLGSSQLADDEPAPPVATRGPVLIDAVAGRHADSRHARVTGTPLMCVTRAPSATSAMACQTSKGTAAGSPYAPKRTLRPLNAARSNGRTLPREKARHTLAGVRGFT